MKRRVCSVLLCLAMCLSLLPTSVLAVGDLESGDTGTLPTPPGGTETADVAQYLTTKYSTLSAAINTAQGTTEAGGAVSPVTLLKDTTEDITISGHVTLDLGGYTLTGNVTVDNSGELALKNGTVSGNVTVNSGGTLTLVATSVDPNSTQYDPSASLPTTVTITGTLSTTASGQTLANMLHSGCAYIYNVDNGAYVERSELGTSLSNIVVRTCPHTGYDSSTSKCLYCDHECTSHSYGTDNKCTTCGKEGSHEHCVCCGNGTNLPDAANHSCTTTTTFEKWDRTDSLPSAAGSYYLSADVTLSSTWTVSADITLCLNGHSITMTSGVTAIQINSGSTLTITDCQKDTDGNYKGKITHASGATGRGVENAGTFHLYGGEISGHTAPDKYYGGAVYSTGCFNMYGGTISNCTGGYYPLTTDLGDKGTIYGGTIDVDAFVTGKIAGGTFGADHKVEVSHYEATGDNRFNVNWGIVTGGTFNGQVINEGNINGGTFKGTVKNDYDINNGTFSGTVINVRSGNDIEGYIYGGEFTASSTVQNSGTIYGGTFYGTVSPKGTIDSGAYKTVTVHVGDTPTKHNVLCGQKFAQPATPTNGNKTFEGWYPDTNYKTPYDFDTPVTANIDLYPKWEDEHYGIYVCGVEVTSANADNVLSDSGKNVTYNASTKTLALNSATLNYDDSAKLSDGTTICNAVIYSTITDALLTVELNGPNSITVKKRTTTTGGWTQRGIYAAGDLNLTGSGSLTITFEDSGGKRNGAYGIHAAGNVTVAEGGAGGAGYINITGGDATHMSYGIYAQTGSVTITNGTTTATGGAVSNPAQSERAFSRGVGAPKGTVAITGGTLTASASDATATDGSAFSQGIAAKDITVSDSAVVTANSNGTATVTWTGTTSVCGFYVIGGEMNVSGTCKGTIHTTSNSTVSITGGTGMELTIQPGTGSTVTISGGSFSSITAPGDTKLASWLADSKAFADSDNKTVNGYVSSLADVTVVDHAEHDWSSKDGQCPCGYACDHDNTNDSGKCTVCDKQVYVAQIGDNKYTTFNEAYNAAAQNSGTIKLLANVTDAATLSKWTFTIDLNGKSMNTVTVNGVANVTVTGSGSVTNLTIRGDYATVKLSGGTYTSIIYSAKNKTCADLLPVGYGFVGQNGWVETTDAMGLSNVTVRTLPVQNVTVKADKNSYTYGEKITLTADCGTAGGGSYQWSLKTKDKVYQEISGATGKTFDPGTLNVGTYTYRCAVTADGVTTVAECTFTVNKATLTYTAPTANDLTYNGDKQALVEAGSTPFGTMQYKLSGSAEWSSSVPKAENAGTYTVCWRIDGGANYKDVTDTTPVQVTISPLEVTVTPNANQSKKFGADDPSLLYSTSGTGDDIGLKEKLDDQLKKGALSREPGNNVGQYKITLGTLSGGKNFDVKLSDTAVYFTINKANAPGLTDVETNIVYTLTPYTVDLSKVIKNMPANAGTVSYSLTGNTDNDISVSGNTLTINKAGAKNDTYTVRVTVSSTNYENATVTVTVKLTDKTRHDDLTVTMSSWTYGGTANTPVFTAPAGTTETEIKYVKVFESGTGSPSTTAPTDAGNYKVYVKCETLTDIWYGTADFTISKASVTIKAADKSAYTFSAAPDLSKPVSGKDYTVTGLIGKDTLESGVTIVLTCSADMTRAGKYSIVPGVTGEDSRYDFVFENGTLTVSDLPVIPSTGSTVKNPDGSSTTTTKDNSTGTVTETTTAPDGTTSTTVTDKDGNVTDISANIPASAAKDGETVTLPIDDVKPADSENAQEIRVTVPTGGATIEIPVEDPTPGTVIVIVNPDGTETVIPTSRLTENGVEFTLESSATIKVVDNSQTFRDVKAGTYYSDAVAWASARNITGGVGGGLFGPEQTCTRAQIVTFLWRAAGQPEPESMHNPFTDISEKDYFFKAVLWAVENGITTGTGNGRFSPDMTCSRAQAVTFIYRNEKANSGGFTDLWMFRLPFSDVPDWCYESVAWCYKEGITDGVGGGLFGTNNDCTRVQIITMLYRYMTR